MFNTRIIHKHDSEANWLKATNFVPKQGELIVYDPDENFNYSRVKIGDGITKVNSLPFHIEAISNEKIDEAPVSKTGILAFVHDYDSVASIIYRRRSHSIYNPRAERFNIFEKADKGYAVDLSENAVVFYIAD